MKNILKIILLQTALYLTSSQVSMADEKQDAKILERGPLSGARITGANILGTFVGFGTGHTVVGKYRDSGWIFTVTDSLTLGTAFVGAIMSLKNIGGEHDNRTQSQQQSDRETSESGRNLAIAGAIGFGISRVVSLIDLNIRASNHNTRYEELTRGTTPQVSLDIRPPTSKDDLGYAGVRLTF